MSKRPSYPAPLDQLPGPVAARLLGEGAEAATLPGITRGSTSTDYLVTSGNVAPTAGFTILIYTSGITDFGAGARKALLDYGWGTGDRGCYLRYNAVSGALEFAVARAGTTASVVAGYTLSSAISNPRLMWARIAADGLSCDVGEGDPALITPGAAAITGGVDTTADAPASYLVQDGDTSHNVVGSFGLAVLERYLSDAEVAAADGSFAAVKAAGAAYPSDWVLGHECPAGTTDINTAADVSDPSGVNTWTIATLSARLQAAS